MQVLLADEDRAGPVEPLDHRRVAGRDRLVRVEHPRAERGRKAERVDLVLHAVRQAMERPAGLAAADLHLGPPRRRQRAIGIDRDPGAQAPVIAVDPVEGGAHELDRRDRPLADEAGLLGAAQMDEVGHGASATRGTSVVYC
jgi:hypothetical protein